MNRRYIIGLAVTAVLATILAVFLPTILLPERITFISNAQATDVYASLYVNRPTSFDQTTVMTKFPVGDRTVISKYPILQDAMKVADERYQEWVAACVPHGCPGLYSVQPWDLSLPTYHISSQFANALINDNNLHLHHHFSHPDVYDSDIRVDNGGYYIQVTFP